MSGTTAPVPSASASGTVTWHVGRTEDVPLAFTLAGHSVDAIPGGTLTVADTSIATATLSADGASAKFVGVKVGTTTASYSNNSGGDPLNATISLFVIADPAADGVTFNAAGASEEPVTAPVAAAPPPAAPAPVAPAAS